MQTDKRDIRTFILGTDWWTDCDDVVAMRILARAHKAGQIRLAAIGMNGCMEHSAASLDGFLCTEGVRDIPLGIDLAANDFGGRPPYQQRLAQYAERYKTNTDAQDAVRLYRRTLADAQDKLELIEVGYLQVLAGLLTSGPDDISPLTGVELMREKVSRTWIMAGRWDMDEGAENNFNRNPRARKAAHEVCALCPVPITFLGFEVGVDVISGSRLPGDDVVHMALSDHGSAKGRSSWDPMLVLLALTGDEQTAGYDTVCGYASVDAGTGINRFRVDAAGPHKYVIRKYVPEHYAQLIDELIG